MDRVQEVWRTQGMKKMNNEREKNNITFFFNLNEESYKFLYFNIKQYHVYKQ